ncbi:MAG TPA: DUF1553 domain-containing protein, partial [Candidatus Saccharimonadia bacterium]|nr:DUF1553 domain-containing protein [Candidatus Saccharimonadia bacterium]
RRLTAEQLFDALHQGLGAQARFEEFPKATKAVQIPGPLNRRKKEAGNDTGVAFLAQFGQPPRLLACECERTDETTMGQSFSLISGPQVNNLLKRKDNVLGRLLTEKSDDAAKVESLYWNVLTRAPSAEEKQAMSALLAKSSNKRAMLEDLAWSLVNAKEFVLRK